VKLTTLIPLRRNDGTDVPPDELATLISLLYEPFDGLSNEGLVRGKWRDPLDGAEFEDETLRIAVVLKSLDELERGLEVVRQIGQKLQQRAMYVEVMGADGAYIIRTDPMSRAERPVQ
jgi:hypothetical protein